MEIVGTLILIIPVLILVLSPLLLFISRRIRRNKKAASEQVSPAAVQEQPKEMIEPIQTKPYRKTTERVQYTSDQTDRFRESTGSPGATFRKIDMLPRLKQAVLWAEILGPPRSLKEQ